VYCGRGGGEVGREKEDESFTFQYEFIGRCENSAFLHIRCEGGVV